MLRAALLTTRCCLSRPSAERSATSAPRLQGPKDSTGEDQVRSDVNARLWRNERLVSLRCAQLRTAYKPPRCSTCLHLLAAQRH